MAKIVLKDMNGNDNTYEGVTAVKLNLDDGNTQTFYKGVPKDITLDFSAGDMEVSEENKVFSSVTIPKPDNLIPENIADGVDIAGIIGKLVAGGEIKVTGGRIREMGAVTIEHGLGVVPDIVIVNGGPYKGCLAYAVGFSNALVSKSWSVTGITGNELSFFAYYTQDNVKEFSWDGAAPGMEYSTTEPAIRNVTAESFTVGSADYHAAFVMSGSIVDAGRWVAISI